MNYNMNGHVLCAVDVETTGLLAGYHEIIQIACVPLDQNFEPCKKRKFFYVNMAPDEPEKMDKEAQKIHGMDETQLESCVSQARGGDLFLEWYQSLDLPLGKRLIPLAHNWGFERAFLIHWLGMDAFSTTWQGIPRDTLAFAAGINDLYEWHGRKHPFHTLKLSAVCNRFDIQLDNAHDALADCLATAKLYASFMRFLCG